MKEIKADQGLYGGKALRNAGAVLLGMVLMLSACGGNTTPKPMGHVRIDLPEKSYTTFTQPWYSFEIPVYAYPVHSRSGKADAGWTNLVVPSLNGIIHLSYKPVSDNVDAYIKDARTLAYKHVVKADGIEESLFMDRENRRFGMVYDLGGQVASSVQFFITDSTSHFLRGSLYFNCPPNADSLSPVIRFLREDIIHLLETTRWNYE